MGWQLSPVEPSESPGLIQSVVVGPVVPSSSLSPAKWEGMLMRSR